MEQDIFSQLAETQNKEEIKSQLNLLKLKNIHDKAEILAKKEGKNLNEKGNVFAYKDDSFIIDYVSESGEIVLSFSQNGKYSMALQSDKDKITYLDCDVLWKNLHKLEQKFNNLSY